MTSAWERLPKESAKAYRAFTLYRDMGPGRTLREVAAVLYGEEYQEGTKRVPGRIKQWSTDHDWVERAQALDARDDQIRQEALEMHKLRAADDIAERRQVLSEKILRCEERAAEIMGKFLDKAEPTARGAVADAVRLHRIATHNDPPWVDLRRFDLESATDEQLQRIIDGEDPAKVLGR